MSGNLSNFNMQPNLLEFTVVQIDPTLWSEHIRAGKCKSFLYATYSTKTTGYKTRIWTYKIQKMEWN